MQNKAQGDMDFGAAASNRAVFFTLCSLPQGKANGNRRVLVFVFQSRSYPKKFKTHPVNVSERLAAPLGKDFVEICHVA